MAVELVRNQAAAAPLPASDDALPIASVVAMVDGAAAAEHARFLAAHFGPLPFHVERRIVRVAERSGTCSKCLGPGAHAFEAIGEALGARESQRRTVIGDFAAAAEGFDGEQSLFVLFRDPAPDGRSTSRAAHFALHRALGSVLLLPEPAALPGTGTPPRAMLVARSAAEIAALLAFARLLSSHVSLALRLVFRPCSSAPAAVLRELEEARETLRRTAAGSARPLHVDTVLQDDPPEEDCTLVVGMARRPLLRRWFGGADGRVAKRSRRPRLLIAPSLRRALRREEVR